MRPKILLIAPHGSYRTAAYLKAAGLEYQIILASQAEHSLIQAYREGWHVDLTDPNLALPLAQRVQAEGITAVLGTDDLTIELASRVAALSGLPHNPPGSALLTRRKDLARQCLARAGVRVPAFRRIDRWRPWQDQLSGTSWPAVIKPISLSASRGVIRADDLPTMLHAIERCGRIVDQAVTMSEDEKRYLLLEQFIPGFEVAVEGMLEQGHLHFIAMFDKPDPLDGPFFEETYYVSPSRLAPKAQQNVFATVEAACKAYGLTQGAIHAECRINPDGIYVIELAARTIGGMCARLFEWGAGLSLEQMVLMNAIGEPFTVKTHAFGLGVLMLPTPRAGVLKRINGIECARQTANVVDLQFLVQPGHEVIPLPEGGSYLGFLFAKGADAASAEQALRCAHKCLRFTIDPLWKLIAT